MQVGEPTLIMPAGNAVQVLPLRLVVRQSADDRTTERDRRDGARGSDVSFRAELDAAMPEGSAAQFVSSQPQQSGFAAETSRPEKRPSSADFEIDSREGAELFADTQNASRAEAPVHDGSSEIPTTLSQQYRSVAHQYAQRFFSIGGTLAARGDKLEVSA